MPGKLSDAQYQQRARDAQKNREQQRRDDLRHLLEDPAGRRVFYWLVRGDPSDDRPAELLGRLESEVF